MVAVALDVRARRRRAAAHAAVHERHLEAPRRHGGYPDRWGASPGCGEPPGEGPEERAGRGCDWERGQGFRGGEGHADREAAPSRTLGRVGRGAPPGSSSSSTAAARVAWRNRWAGVGVRRRGGWREREREREREMRNRGRGRDERHGGKGVAVSRVSRRHDGLLRQLHLRNLSPPTNFS